MVTVLNRHMLILNSQLLSYYTKLYTINEIWQAMDMIYTYISTPKGPGHKPLAKNMKADTESIYLLVKM